MATTQQRAEKYAEWLVSNKDKQGSPEWSTVSQAYKQLRTGMIEPEKKAQIEPKAIDVADIAQSGYSGIIRGVEAVASLPDLAAQGISFLLEKPMGLLGFERMTREEKMALPGYVDIQKEVIEPTATALGARYQPKTVAGELAQRTGELLPFAGARPLTFAAAPAAAGYAAEKTAEKAGAGEGLQLAARIAGEIAAPVPTAKTLETIKAVTDLRKTNTPRVFLSSNSSAVRMSISNIRNNNYQLKGFEDDFMYLLEIGPGSHYGRYNDTNYWEEYYENAANYLAGSSSNYYFADKAGVNKDYLVFKPGTYDEVTVNPQAFH